MIDPSAIRERFAAVGRGLNERTRRLFAAVEARTAGYGGIEAASQATGIARSIPRVVEDPRKLLRGGGFWIRLQGMIRGGFLSAKERADLTALARNGLAEHRVA